MRQMRDVLHSTRSVLAARALAALGALLLGGCTSFHRTVVNAHVKDIDTAWIEPGKTTKDEIVARIGRPPSVVGIKDPLETLWTSDGLARYYASCLTVRPWGIDARDEDVDGPEMNAFRWCSVDFFSGRFEGGKWIVPTFGKGHVRRMHDILVLFDARDVVTLLSRTEYADDKIRILEWKEAKQ